MKDIRYILKRIIIGTGIALAIMFIKQNVYAYEWETSADIQVFDENRVFVNANAILPNFSSFTYPSTWSSSSLSQNFVVGSHAGAYNNANLVSRGTPIPFLINNLQVYLFNVSLTAGQRYKLIIPYAYNDNIYTSLSSNVNEDFIFDSSSYSFNYETITLNSVSLAFGVENDLQDNANYPYYLYFNIQFTPTEDITNQDVTLYIGYYSSNYSVNITALNTYTYSNNNINTIFTSKHINDSSAYWTNNFYKPFLYTTSSEAEDWYIDDGNDAIADSTSDIKGKIDEIVDGVFGDNEDFPYINLGGQLFGDNEYTLQDLFLVPLKFLKGFVQNSSECVGPTIPLPGWLSNYNFTLPCPSVFLATIFPLSFIALIKQIFGVVVSYYIICHLYNDVIKALSPDDLKLVDAWMF